MYVLATTLAGRLAFALDAAAPLYPGVEVDPVGLGFAFVRAFSWDGAGFSGWSSSGLGGVGTRGAGVLSVGFGSAGGEEAWVAGWGAGLGLLGRQPMVLPGLRFRFRFPFPFPFFIPSGWALSWVEWMK